MSAQFDLARWSECRSGQARCRRWSQNKLVFVGGRKARRQKLIRLREAAVELDQVDQIDRATRGGARGTIAQNARVFGRRRRVAKQFERFENVGLTVLIFVEKVAHRPPRALVRVFQEKVASRSDDGRAKLQLGLAASHFVAVKRRDFVARLISTFGRRVDRFRFERIGDGGFDQSLFDSNMNAIRCRQFGRTVVACRRKIIIIVITAI